MSYCWLIIHPYIYYNIYVYLSIYVYVIYIYIIYVSQLRLVGSPNFSTRSMTHGAVPGSPVKSFAGAQHRRSGQGVGRTGLGLWLIHICICIYICNTISIYVIQYIYIILYHMYVYSFIQILGHHSMLNNGDSR